MKFKGEGKDGTPGKKEGGFKEDVEVHVIGGKRQR